MTEWELLAYIDYIPKKKDSTPEAPEPKPKEPLPDWADGDLDFSI